jgi:hypothetical protein
MSRGDHSIKRHPTASQSFYEAAKPAERAIAVGSQD